MPDSTPSIQLRLASELAPSPENARLHDDEQIELLIRSFEEFGYTNPILADADGIVAGHGRQTAVLRLYERGGSLHFPNGDQIPAGMVPVVDVSGWTAERRRAYLLADNALTLRGEWDEAKLLAELEALQALDFPIDLIGFDAAELDRLFNPPQPGKTDPNEMPEDPGFIATVRGDLWLLGNHRLKCGDATSAEDVDSVLDGRVPHLMITDPPYGVNYRPAWRNEALPVWKKSRATGVVKNDDRCDWREAWELFPGDVGYVWFADTKRLLVEQSLNSCGFEVRSCICWVKQNFVISRGDYHPQHEPCLYVVRKGKKGHWNGDRTQSTVWEIRNGSSVGGGDSDDKHTGHGTQKPVECMRRPMLNNSRPADLIYEPFSGSGTTLISCEMEGRHCRAIELDPTYVDMAILRYQDFTGQEARLEATGQTFAEVRVEREAVTTAA